MEAMAVTIGFNTLSRRFFSYTIPVQKSYSLAKVNGQPDFSPHV
jgi:hypothetical protein